MRRWEGRAGLGSRRLKGLTLAQIAERVTKPFGVMVVVPAPAGAPLPDVQIQQGETVHALIERLARAAGLLVTDDAQGRLVLTRAGYGPRTRAAGALVQGQNILAAAAELDTSAVFSEYEVKAHNPPPDDPADWGQGDGAANGGGDEGPHLIGREYVCRIVSPRVGGPAPSSSRRSGGRLALCGPPAG